MGLRINTNTVGIVALRNLQIHDYQQSLALERLSSGVRLNRASDDPTAFTIAETLRAQIESADQAVSNSNNARNLVNTAESALDEVSNMLINIRESILFALNTGGTSQDQVAAEQDAVDAAVSAIERIAQSTRFGGNDLLNGNAAFDIVTTFPTTGITEVLPLKARFDITQTTTTFTVDVQQQATQATVSLGATANTVIATGGDVTLAIRGTKGVEIVTLAADATRSDLENAISLARGNTGIYVDNGFAVTEGFGTQASLEIEQIGGSGTYNETQGIFNGIDAVATVNGAAAAANGNRLTVISETFTGEIRLRSAPEGGTAGTHNFELVNKSGMLFQLGEVAHPQGSEILGIPSILPDNLGGAIEVLGAFGKGGFLNSLRTGGDNSLFVVAGFEPPSMTTDPVTLLPVPIDTNNALRVVDAAIEKVLSIRSSLGSFVSQTIEPNINNLETMIENLTKSESTIRDIDFAEETANFTRAQILFQAGTSVLGQANSLTQTVISLLQT